MLYREMIAVCSQIHPKHINTLCAQNGEFLNIKPGGTYSDSSSCNIPCRKVKPVGLPALVRLHCLQFFHPAIMSFSCRFVSSYFASQYCNTTRFMFSIQSVPSPRLSYSSQLHSAPESCYILELFVVWYLSIVPCVKLKLQDKVLFLGQRRSLSAGERVLFAAGRSAATVRILWNVSLYRLHHYQIPGIIMCLLHVHYDYRERAGSVF